jgi:very-short-patch-repair endonuclease
MGYVIAMIFTVFFIWLAWNYIKIVRMPIPKESYEQEIWKCESPIERRLYKGLINNQLYPVPQYPVGRYRIDLAFPYQMIAIECDGKAYHSTPKQKAHDRKKDKFLQSKGWTVLRFTGSRIHRDLSGVVRKISVNVREGKQYE